MAFLVVFALGKEHISQKVATAAVGLGTGAGVVRSGTQKSNLSNSGG